MDRIKSYEYKIHIPDLQLQNEVEKFSESEASQPNLDEWFLPPALHMEITTVTGEKIIEDSSVPDIFSTVFSDWYDDSEWAYDDYDGTIIASDIVDSLGCDVVMDEIAHWCYNTWFDKLVGRTRFLQACSELMQVGVGTVEAE